MPNPISNISSYIRPRIQPLNMDLIHQAEVVNEDDISGIPLEVSPLSSELGSPFPELNRLHISPSPMERSDNIRWVLNDDGEPMIHIVVNRDEESHDISNEPPVIPNDPDGRGPLKEEEPKIIRVTENKKSSDMTHILDKPEAPWVIRRIN